MGMEASVFCLKGVFEIRKDLSYVMKRKRTKKVKLNAIRKIFQLFI